MRTSLISRSIGIITIALVGALFATAQSTAEKYLISAKAGGINYVEGSARVLTESGNTMAAIKGGSIRDGETISTEADGKVELLLNPGSFVRMGSDSEVRFDSTNLNNVRIAVNRGSAIFEVYATNDFDVNVETPKGRIVISKTGVYRFDVAADGAGSVSVIKGDLMVGNVAVRSGRSLGIGIANATVVKTGDLSKDALSSWSRSRSEAVAKATNSLQRDSLRNSLTGSLMSNQWSFFDGFGLWVFNSRFGGHCFLPFGVNWNSPYGHWYRRGFFHYSWPDWVWIRATTPPVAICAGGVPCGNGQNNNSVANTISNPPAGAIMTKRDRENSSGGNVRPPFQAIESTIRPSRVFGNDRSFDMDQPIRVSSPGFGSPSIGNAPSATAPPAAAPADIQSRRPRGN